MAEGEKMQQYTIGQEATKKEEDAKKAHPGRTEPTMNIKRQSADDAQPYAPKKFRWNAKAAEWGEAAWSKKGKQREEGRGSKGEKSGSGQQEEGNTTQGHNDSAAADNAAAANAAAEGRDGNGTTFNANELGLHAMVASPCPPTLPRSDLHSCGGLSHNHHTRLHRRLRRWLRLMISCEVACISVMSSWVMWWTQGRPQLLLQ